MRYAGLLVMLSLLGALPAGAMERVWTRTTGQYRYESTPALADIDGDGAQEVLGVNNGGQVLAWKLDGTDAGAGQDGLVAQLPEGEWTSTPAVAGNGAERRYVFCNTAGLVVCLDASWQPVWQHQLPGKTAWSRATPLVAEENAQLIIGDLSGTISCLSKDGAVVWTAKPGEGGCKTLVQRLDTAEGMRILAPVGNVLYALDASGAAAWSRDLGGGILSQPMTTIAEGKTLVICAGGASLHALNDQGAIEWQAVIGDEVDTSITFLPRAGEPPLVLCTGLWGNCHAFELDGRPAWTHVFRSKNRTRPLVIDANGDGALDVLIAAYNQHAYVLDSRGHRMDDVRVSGAMNASPLGLEGGDVLLVSTTLLAHRFAPGAPKPLFASGETKDPAIRWDDAAGRVVVENPDCGLLRINVETGDKDGGVCVAGVLSARRQVALEVPGAVEHTRANVVVCAAGGAVLQEAEHVFTAVTVSAPSAGLALRATAPYGDAEWLDVSPSAEDGAMHAANLYGGEVGQAACLLNSTLETSVAVRLDWSAPQSTGGGLFQGSIIPRQALGVGTINGETVHDALVPLDPARVVIIPPRTTVKLWFTVDTKGAEPGVYQSMVKVQPLQGESPVLELPLDIEVLPMDLPAIPLTFCTWDYLPNQWFPAHTPENLDDMAAHGVNVFPRSGVPTAQWRENRLEMDFAPADLELDRLTGRGEILFHVGEPTIEGADSLPPEQRHGLQIEYLRRFRDHLREKGCGYDLYGFYPVDEPGLDYGPRIPVFMAAAKLFREADPKIRIYTDPVPGLSKRDFEEIAPFVDIWCPNMRMVTGIYLDDPRMQAIMASGKPVWSYECISQVKSVSPLRYNRGNAWRAWHFGLDGIGHWTYSTTQANHWFANADKNDEYALMYPGEHPVPSVRWEAVRDGLEDIAAMRMLEELIEANRAKAGREEAVRKAERTVRMARTDILELVEDAFVESRDYLKAGDRRVWHGLQDDAVFDEHRAAIARATADLLP